MRARMFAAALSAAALVVTGCASEDNIYTQPRPEKDPIAITVDSDSTEQIVLGEIYSHVLNSQGRPTSVTAVRGVSRAAPVQVLRELRTDFVVTCTGRMLRYADPAAEQDLGGGDMSDVEYTDRVYAAAVATLPGDMRSVDPSPAQGCGEEGDVPQNIIPVFYKGTFDRGEMNRLNFITRALSTEKLTEMAEEVESGARVEDAIADWMMEYAQIDVHFDAPSDPEDAADPDSAD